MEVLSKNNRRVCGRYRVLRWPTFIMHYLPDFVITKFNNVDIGLAC